MARVSGSASTVMAYSDMLTANRLPLLRASKSRWLPSSASAASTASATRGRISSASGVSSKPRPERTSSSSSKCLRSRARAPLIAGWLIVIRSPAWVRLRSSSSACSESSRLASTSRSRSFTRSPHAPPHRSRHPSRRGHPSVAPMALGGTDLNLLLPLKVLLEEGNVTRAGQRLELSQPAMSAALARLRRRFDDELLVRSGRDYELTPFARDLLPEVQRALRLMGAALHLEDEFDPTPSERTFRLAMSDYATAVVHEPLVRLVQGEAPGVRLLIAHLGPGVRESPTSLIEHDALVAP